MAATAAVRLRGRFRGSSFLYLEAEVAEPADVDLDVLKRIAGPLEYELYLDGHGRDGRDGRVQRRVASSASGASGSGRHSVRFELPATEVTFELWLPTSVALDVFFLDSDGIAVDICEFPEFPRWICYGSSITHGGPSGSSASTSWPALCARGAKWELCNLGFGAECYLDPSVAMVIRDTPCDFITLEVGINIQTTTAMNVRTFSSALMGFIRIIREAHGVPILVISPLRYGPLEDRAPLNKAEFMSLKELRHCTRSCVETLAELGDQSLGPSGSWIMPDQFDQFCFLWPLTFFSQLH